MAEGRTSLTNLKGSHTPVYCGPALLNFFSKATLNLYDGNVTINLMDFFPLLKQGYALRSILSTFNDNYTRAHNLQDPNNPRFIIPDALYNESFGGNISAGLFSYRDVGGKLTNIPMEEAVDSGLISNYLNTYQVMESLYPQGTINQSGQAGDFNPQRFPIYFYQTINSLNYTKIGVETLNQDVIDSLIEEELLSKEINSVGQEVSGKIKNGDIYFFIKMAMSTKNLNILNALLNHPNVNSLYTSIMLKDINAITNNLQLIDPRSDDFRAYHLAEESGDPFIINLIKDNIIQRNLLQQSAFTNTIRLQGGGTNLPNVISQYANNYTYGRI